MELLSISLCTFSSVFIKWWALAMAFIGRSWAVEGRHSSCAHSIWAHIHTSLHEYSCRANLYLLFWLPGVSFLPPPHISLTSEIHILLGYWEGGRAFFSVMMATHFIWLQNRKWCIQRVFSFYYTNVTEWILFALLGSAVLAVDDRKQEESLMGQSEAVIIKVIVEGGLLVLNWMDACGNHVACQYIYPVFIYFFGFRVCNRIESLRLLPTSWLTSKIVCPKHALHSHVPLYRPQIFYVCGLGSPSPWLDRGKPSPFFVNWKQSKLYLLLKAFLHLVQGMLQNIHEDFAFVPAGTPTHKHLLLL